MRKSILIINENIDEAAKIKERLVSAYNDVECVTSIHDAVNLFVNMDFTLVILDANMSMEDDHIPTQSLSKAQLWGNCVHL